MVKPGAPTSRGEIPDISTLRVIYAARADDTLILRNAREQIAGCARLFPLP